MTFFLSHWSWRFYFVRHSQNVFKWGNIWQRALCVADTCYNLLFTHSIAIECIILFPWILFYMSRHPSTLTQWITIHVLLSYYTLMFADMHSKHFYVVYTNTQQTSYTTWTLMNRVTFFTRGFRSLVRSYFCFSLCSHS